MAKGSVRKKGKKWYGRFYIEDESGRKVQKEFAGTESKAETEAMLRKAIADYEEKQFVGKAENITVGDMLDMWVEEELKPGNLSNGTVMSYQGTVNRIKQYPIGKRKLKTVTADHLQAFIDFLSYGGTNPDGTTSKPMSKGYMLLFSAVLQNSFRFAVRIFSRTVRKILPVFLLSPMSSSKSWRNFSRQKTIPPCCLCR